MSPYRIGIERRLGHQSGESLRKTISSAVEGAGKKELDNIVVVSGLTVKNSFGEDLVLLGIWDAEVAQKIAEEINKIDGLQAKFSYYEPLQKLA